MSRHNQCVFQAPAAEAVATCLMWPRTREACALSLGDSLRAPIDGELRRRVQALVRRGERMIVLDLARVPTIDAAGVGELMRAYKTMAAANGALRIVHANRRVHEILERAGLFRLLSADWDEIGLATVE